MSETFYGPWSLRVGSPGSHVHQRFVIQGSADSDGPHGAPHGPPLLVTGDEWKLTMEWHDQQGFHTAGIHRAAEYDVQSGLSVTLVADVALPGMTPDGGMVVVAHSEDPSTNPDAPQGNPIDLTLPEGAIDFG